MKARIYRVWWWVVEFRPTPRLHVFASCASFDAALAFLRHGDESGVLRITSKERP